MRHLNSSALLATATSLDSLEFMRDPYGFLEAKRRAHGDVFASSLGSHGVYVFVGDPDLIEQLQKAPPYTFRGDGGNALLSPLFGSKSLLLLDGQAHRRERKLLRPAFHRRSVQSFGDSIREHTLARIDQWDLDAPIELRAELQHIALHVIIEILFGAERAPHIEDFATHVEAIFDDPKCTLPIISALGASWKQSTMLQNLRGAIASARRLCREEIAWRREQAGSAAADAGVCGMLMAATYEDGAPMEEDAIVDELLTLTITGHETVVTSLLWAFHWLFEHPDVHRTLRDAVRALGDAPSLKKVLGDAYLDAFCSEVLRMHPIVPIVARRVAEPTTLGGVELRAGWTIAPAISLLHTHTPTYGDPEVFRPERFLDGKPSAHAYMPFGMGVRRCLGATLAIHEMKIVLATLLRRLSIRPASDTHFFPTRRLVTVTPTTHLPILFVQGAGVGLR